MEAVAAALPKEDDFPNAEVLVATTWNCNLRCRYCFVKAQTTAPGRGNMTQSLARQVVDGLDEGMQHVESICIHLYGGEPLTNIPAMRAMIERAACKPAGRFSFAITTNGSIATPEVIDLLDQGRFQIILSIDGPAEIHDACRRTLGGHPTHANVIDFLHKVKRSTCCSVRGSAVVRSGWSLEQAERYLRTLPVDSIKAQAVRVPAEDPSALSRREKRQYLEDLEAVAQRIIGELERGEIPRDDRYSTRVLQLLAGRSRAHFCGAGHTTFGIAPDGTLSPCVLLDSETDRLGNIRDDPRRWLAAGAEWLSAKQQRAACGSCDAAPLCGGGCPAIIPVCGADECEIIRRNCAMARRIFERFRDRPEALLLLAGIA